MTAEVHLILAEAENALIVPANAVFSEGGSWYIGISNGTVCNDTPVKIGLTTDSLVQISSGFLNEGDPVCVPSVDNSVLRDMGLENIEKPDLQLSGGSDLPTEPVDERNED